MILACCHSLHIWSLYIRPKCSQKMLLDLPFDPVPTNSDHMENIKITTVDGMKR